MTNERIEHALRNLGAEHEPPAGWEARVIREVQPPRRAKSVITAVVLLMVAAIAISAARVWRQRVDPFRLDVEVQHIHGAMRGDR